MEKIFWAQKIKLLRIIHKKYQKVIILVEDQKNPMIRNLRRLLKIEKLCKKKGGSNFKCMLV